MFIIFIIFMLINCFSGQQLPNFLIILTDDQDLLLNGLKPMEKTLKLVANNGVTFNNYYVNSPICCPSRSTILTGTYAHNHKTVNNTGNCNSANWRENFESQTIASYLKQMKNYTTFYGGKYLNQYKNLRHIPNGYDWWIGLEGNSKYYNYSLSINGTRHFFQKTYLTDNLLMYGMRFLKEKPKLAPFFMMVAPPAPHAPFTPAERHRNHFTNCTVIKNPAFNYSSNDKHWLVTMAPRYLPEKAPILNVIQRKRQQSLLAVDEMIGKFIKQLKKQLIFNNTYIIVTSDNGFHIGQFTQPWDKRQPYESDVHVPFLMCGPNIERKTQNNQPIASVDLLPTILDLTGINLTSHFDGQSFRNILFDNNNKNFDRFLLIEYWGEFNKSIDRNNCPNLDENLAQCSLENWCKCQDSRNNTYSCLLHISTTEKVKFCQFADESNFVEFYDLEQDPYELKNIYKYMNEKTIEFYVEKLKKLKKCSGKNCNTI